MSKKSNRKTTDTVNFSIDVSKLSRQQGVELFSEYSNKVDAMTDDRDNKCKSAKEQLIESLKVTADKYRTGTGVMESLRVMRMVNDGAIDDMKIFDEIEHARDLAAAMVEEVSKLTKKAEDLKPENMDDLCKDSYNEDFISEEFTAMDLCFELMRLDLCRNVGPAAEDMVEFYNHTTEEIQGIRDKMTELNSRFFISSELK